MSSLSKVTSGVKSFLNNVDSKVRNAGNQVKNNFNSLDRTDKVLKVAGPIVLIAGSIALAANKYAPLAFSAIPLGAAIACGAVLASIAVFGIAVLASNLLQKPTAKKVVQPTTRQIIAQKSKQALNATKKALNTTRAAVSQAVSKTAKFVKAHPYKAALGLATLYTANAVRVNYRLESTDLSRTARLGQAIRTTGANAKAHVLNSLASGVDRYLQAKHSPNTKLVIDLAKVVGNTVSSTVRETANNIGNAILEKVQDRVATRHSA